ncbi:MAG: hypothetical protein ACKVS9_11420 [Phycisphaerae bacterium]
MLLLTGCAATVRAPRERDAWYEYVADGQRYGYERTTVVKLPDGNYEYKTESRVLINLLGAGEQEFSSRASYVVTPDYRPVRFEGEGHQTAGSVSARGRVVDRNLEVEFSRAGVSGQGTIDLTPDAQFAVCLSDWLHARPILWVMPADGAATTVNVTMINEERWCRMPGTLTMRRRDEAGSEWSFDFGLDAGQGTQFYDAAGVPIETRMRAPKMHVRRCDADDAQKITCRGLTGRDLLMFPIDGDIGNPERLAALSVRLTWKTSRSSSSASRTPANGSSASRPRTAGTKRSSGSPPRRRSLRRRPIRSRGANSTTFSEKTRTSVHAIRASLPPHATP